MGCHRITDSGNGIGYICTSGPASEKKLRKSNRWKWCFNCHKRLPHMLTATIEKTLSYYEPSVWWKCSRCKKDYTTFWGY